MSAWAGMLWQITVGVSEMKRWRARCLWGLALAATVAGAGGCAPPARRPDTGAAQGIPFERIAGDARARLPGDVKGWVDANYRKRGTYIKHSGGRSYILVAWGEKPTGGYTVRIEDVARGRRGEVVVVKLDAPGPGQSVTQAVTYPFDLVRTPRLPRSAVFAYRGDLTLTSPLPAPGPQVEEREKRGEGAEGERAEGARSENFIVTSPRPGEVIASPVRIAGRARVFEGAFTIEIEDGHNVLARRAVQASAGAPDWGSFDVSVPFERPTSPAGAIIFVTSDPRDGSRREELILPVRFSR